MAAVPRQRVIGLGSPRDLQTVQQANDTVWRASRLSHGHGLREVVSLATAWPAAEDAVSAPVGSVAVTPLVAIDLHPAMEQAQLEGPQDLLRAAVERPVEVVDVQQYLCPLRRVQIHIVKPMDAERTHRASQRWLGQRCPLRIEIRAQM
eukprot:CAMPEP_0171066076 /NCGR_PEP_ID=MMETSP0766_2-20121228/7215_1 /TAXON_ID=439317 /ORGANISM="Gambierdiscus australes, Strain CAWD 149" /LENGTH=148 /DNA_ID=CAMNT_0011522229 /DNA_START=262 /DNA_END=706 /DNA_ORIENTATION=-